MFHYINHPLTGDPHIHPYTTYFIILLLLLILVLLIIYYIYRIIGVSNELNHPFTRVKRLNHPFDFWIFISTQHNPLEVPRWKVPMMVIFPGLVVSVPSQVFQPSPWPFRPHLSDREKFENSSNFSMAAILGINLRYDKWLFSIWV